jgi:hypothetical protein
MFAPTLAYTRTAFANAPQDTVRAQPNIGRGRQSNFRGFCLSVCPATLSQTPSSYVYIVITWRVNNIQVPVG